MGRTGSDLRPREPLSSGFFPWVLLDLTAIRCFLFSKIQYRAIREENDKERQHQFAARRVTGTATFDIVSICNPSTF